MNPISIHPSWQQLLAAEIEKPYFKELSENIHQEYAQTTVYPSPQDIFRALDLCPVDQVKVVIIGQDPYHGPNQANGLAFAVHEGVPIPPSLKNIFKEIKQELGVEPLASGDLSRWAEQGVLLLNSVLTVEAHNPASHKKRGWETFTDAVIRELSTHKPGLVYILWGKYAQTKGTIINRETNLVLESAHPSPFSASKFFGHNHFGKCNEYLERQGKEVIDWR